MISQLLSALCLILPLVQSLYVQNGTHLVQLLCNNQQLPDHQHLILNHSISYDISYTGVSCAVSLYRRSLTMTSDSFIATVTCVNKEHAIGFLFTDGNVTVSGIYFNGCGALLNNTFTPRLNSTPPYFTKSNSALFTLIDISVTFRNVIFQNYSGFAIIILNTPTTVLDIAVNQRASMSDTLTGSGVLIMFTNQHVQNGSTVIIQNSEFNGNLEYTSINKRCRDPFDNTQVIHATALTYICHNNTYPTQLSIINTKFIGNTATNGGLVLISMDSSIDSYVYIEQSVFHHNSYLSKHCGGTVLSFYANLLRNSKAQVLTIKDTEVYKNSDQSKLKKQFLSEYGAIVISLKQIKVPIQIHFERIVCSKHYDLPRSGVCMTVIGSQYITPKNNVTVVLHSITATGNYQFKYSKTNGTLLFDAGIFVFENIHKVIVSGSHDHPSIFQYNGGSVIYAIHSVVIVKGHVNFNNNYAHYGAAFNLKQSLLILNDNLNITLKNNTAKHLGGAIYILYSFQTESRKCALQFNPTNLTVVSSNNIAEDGGNIMYAYPIYNCYNNDSPVTNKTSHYTQHFNNGDDNVVNNHLLPVSTRASATINCSKITKLVWYAGQTIEVSLRAVDEAGNAVWSQISVSTNLFKISSAESVQETRENNEHHCSNMKLTMTFDNIEIRTIQYYGGLNILTAVFKAPYSREFLYIPMDPFLKCPLGFNFSSNGVCDCAEPVQWFYKEYRYPAGTCNITQLTISKPLLTTPCIWIGEENGTTVVAGSCPISFCNAELPSSNFHYNDKTQHFQIYYGLHSNKPLCRDNRQGIMCSECIEGYSVVFGSDECHPCSNWWLLTLLLYIGLGPLVICVIYCLRLTLTMGTLNGIILFGQVSNIGLKQHLILAKSYKFLSSSISFLQLSACFPLCFFDGMDEAWKAGLGILFPLYLLVVLCFIIVLARFWTWLSRKVSRHFVQVLVTVVHLSVAGLLTAVIEVSIPVKVYSMDGNRTIWSKGSDTYLTGKHAIVFTVTVFVAGLILIPYIAILLCGTKSLKWSKTCNIYIRPALEAIHAPYKVKQQHWFLGQLVFVITMYIVYAANKAHFNSSLDLYIAIMLLLLTIGLAFFSPLKNRIMNLVDMTILFNTTILYFLMFFYKNKYYVQSRVIDIVFFTSLDLIIAITIAIFIYHILVVTGQLKIVQNVLTKLKNIFKKLCNKFQKKSTLSINCNDPIPDNHHWSDYREPLLASQRTCTTTTCSLQQE